MIRFTRPFRRDYPFFSLGETMSKAFILSCVDPRLHHAADTLVPLMGVDAAYNMRLGGPDGILATDAYPKQKEAILEEFKRFKGSYAAIAVAGHTTCAGNAVDDETHRAQTIAAAKALRAFLPIGADVPVHAYLFVRGATDQDWSVEDLGT
jgi:hypothetical protein